MTLVERAIILSKTKYGEADLILKVISATGEVYSVIAKSALKSKRRFGGGVLEPTHYVSIKVNKKNNAMNEKLSVLEDAQVLEDFKDLKTDYDRLELALHFVRSVSVVAQEGDSHLELFNLLGHALRQAQTATALTNLKLQFNLKLLHLQGVLPPSTRYTPALKTSIRDSDVLEFSSDESYDLHQEVDYIYSNYVGMN